MLGGGRVVLLIVALWCSEGSGGGCGEGGIDGDCSCGGGAEPPQCWCLIPALFNVQDKPIVSLNESPAHGIWRRDYTMLKQVSAVQFTAVW